jgi:hypothetical protein
MKSIELKSCLVAENLEGKNETSWAYPVEEMI